MFTRELSLNPILERKSLFLFGPRQTGKSTFLKKNYPEALFINLLEKKTYDYFFQNTDALKSELEVFSRKNNSPLVIIDEVQKLPWIIDEVHNAIENDKNSKFILTGSSARKLKRSGSNFLGGRASRVQMFPLVFSEISSELKTIKDLERRLLIGGLPSIFTSPKPFDDLDDYISLYLNEEIRAEGIVRNYENFHRFLFSCATTNSNLLNFTQLGSDAQIPPRTVIDYYQIIEDTMLGFFLLPFEKTPSRKAVSTSKFYLFDTGVVNGILRRESLSSGTIEFGSVFEHFVISEIRAYFSYRFLKHEMFFWRSASKLEVDLIIQTPKEIWAIEIKSKSKISSKDCNGIKAFCQDYPLARKLFILLDCHHHVDSEGIEQISILDFLKELWSNQYFNL